MRRFFTCFIVSSTVFILSSRASAQGYVGIGTTTPAEKLDVNGAMIIRGDATMATPVAGTIRWNSTDGMHDGRTGISTWRRLENNYSLVSGTYYTTGCGAALTTSVGGGVTTSGGSYDTPFSTSLSDKRTQYLYTASELISLGYCAGNISAVGFSIVTLGTSTINNFTIKLKNSASTSFTGTTWETGVTTCFGPSTVTLAVGTNTFTLGTAFYWDGTSSLLVEICYDNSPTIGTNSTVQVLNTGVAKNRYYYATLALLSGCTTASALGTQLNRPNIILTGVTVGPSPTTTNYIQCNYPWVVGSPTIPAPYVHHGPGSVTGKAIYDDNVLLSDYVFDKYYDGTVSPEDAAKYADYKMASLNEMSEYIARYRHLPTIDGRDDWMKNGQFSAGELSTQLWETAETQALYIIELKKRIDALKTISANPVNK